MVGEYSCPTLGSGLFEAMQDEVAPLESVGETCEKEAASEGSALLWLLSITGS